MPLEASIGGADDLTRVPNRPLPLLAIRRISASFLRG